ncbi:LysM peptidoglycan-binding domain-containing protein [Prosthecobacter sp.]|jgi:LysM repeat protein|uniref:LysM peptidoglycan-binding domain-containing protein n=1 Tax=Prosthecobacter sp. TaxID=1965333 RepID=UPI0037848828
MKMQTTSKPKKEKKLLLNLIDGERHRHRVALVTEEGEWNQHEPNSGMARMFVVMLLVHVVLIGGIIIYDFMGDEETPQQTVTQAARAMSSSSTSGLPEASPEIVSAQAQAAANTELFDNYEMRSGDSLRTIAAKFGTTEEEITKLNMIDKGLQIGPGTMLRVPKQAVPSAIPVDPKTLKPKDVAEEVPKAIPVQDQPPVTNKEPSEAVKPSEAPASLSAATTPMSLIAPGEASSSAGSLAAAADLPATAAAPPESTVAALPPPTKPNVVSLLQENAPQVEDKPKQAAKAEPKPLAKPNPVPPPTQMLKKIADTPPATKKTEPVKKSVADAPPAPKKSEPARTVPKAVAARTHTLQPGETLYRLSSKYGVSVAAIQKANNIKNPNAMRDGMKLVIPAK